MKLALLGYPIDHSLSPALYKEFLQDKLTCYELLSCSSPAAIPSLKDLASRLDGLNITTPYKKHFLNEVVIPRSAVKELGAINTLSFTPQGVLATNTDMLAVEEILKNYQKEFPQLSLLLLGSGVMAKMTELISKELGIKLQQFSRSTHPDLSAIDLTGYRVNDAQNIIINACSRSFVFTGRISPHDIFWDYNYSFSPHASTLPGQVKSYQDGQAMLRLQALAAIKFWQETNPKLKC
jgi:shikimate dehydrogenase